MISSQSQRFVSFSAHKNPIPIFCQKLKGEKSKSLVKKLLINPIDSSFNKANCSYRMCISINQINIRFEDLGRPRLLRLTEIHRFDQHDYFRQLGYLEIEFHHIN